MIPMRVNPDPSSALAVLAASPSALAHGGHGDPRWYGSVLHFLVEPVHLPWTLALSAAVLFAVRWVARARRARAGRDGDA